MKAEILHWPVWAFTLLLSPAHRLERSCDYASLAEIFERPRYNDAIVMLYLPNTPDEVIDFQGAPSVQKMMSKLLHKTLMEIEAWTKQNTV